MEMFVSPDDKPATTHKLTDWAHGQLATKVGIPKVYYQKCLTLDPELLAANVNRWWGQISLDAKDAGKPKRVLVRLLGDKIRALLSDRYRIVDHLDLATIAVQVITAQDGEQENPWARGARCFTWALNDIKMDLGLVNPGMVVDLENLERGVQCGCPGDKTYNAGGGTGFVYPGAVHEHDKTIYNWGDRPKPPTGTHPVFPAAFVKNHEGGGGSAIIEVGMYEAVCDNTCRIGKSLVRRHIGGTLEMHDLDSPETLRRQNELVFSRFADTLRQAFDPDKFLALCKKFKGLEDTEVPGVIEAVDQIVKVNGLTPALREDILAAYTPATPGRDTVLDVQRAITNAANSVRDKDYDAAEDLERVGGRLIMAGI
jgi:hypothetical protein